MLLNDTVAFGDFELALLSFESLAQIETNENPSKDATYPYKNIEPQRTCVVFSFAHVFLFAISGRCRI